MDRVFVPIRSQSAGKKSKSFAKPYWNNDLQDQWLRIQDGHQDGKDDHQMSQDGHKNV